MHTKSDFEAYIASLPVDDEPVTDEDLEAMAEAHADIAAGRVYSTEEVLRELALSDAEDAESS
jgi:hypothetical protein